MLFALSGLKIIPFSEVWNMLKTGKLDSRLLEEIVFKNIKYKRPEVITRPGVGEDCGRR